MPLIWLTGIGRPAFCVWKTPCSPPVREYCGADCTQPPIRIAEAARDQRAGFIGLSYRRYEGGLKGRPGARGGVSVCATCTIAAVPTTGTIRFRIGIVPASTITIPVAQSAPALARRHAF